MLIQEENSEELVFFTKGEARPLRANAKKNKATALDNNINVMGKDAKEIKDILELNDLPLSYMKGSNGMLPTKFVYNPPSKKERLHQAEKPVGLFKELLSYIVKKGETVLDQFCGLAPVGEDVWN